MDAYRGRGALIIVVGIIANLNIWFRPTSLFNTLLILGLLAGGIGLVSGRFGRRRPRLRDNEHPLKF